MTKEEINIYIELLKKDNAVDFYAFCLEVARNLFYEDLLSYEKFLKNSIGLQFQHVPVYVLAKDIKKIFLELDYGDDTINEYIYNFCQEVLIHVDDNLLMKFP